MLFVFYCLCNFCVWLEWLMFNDKLNRFGDVGFEGLFLEWLEGLFEILLEVRFILFNWIWFFSVKVWVGCCLFCGNELSKDKCLFFFEFNVVSGESVCVFSVLILLNNVIVNW